MEEVLGIIRAIHSVIGKIEIIAGSFLYQGGIWNKEATKISLDFTLRHLEEIRVAYKDQAPVLEKILEWLEVQFSIFANNSLNKSEKEAKAELLRILIDFENKLQNVGGYKEAIYKHSNIGLLHKTIRELRGQKI